MQNVKIDQYLTKHEGALCEWQDHNTWFKFLASINEQEIPEMIFDAENPYDFFYELNKNMPDS